MFKKNIKKRNLSLLEVCVSLFIIAILLSLVFGYFSQVVLVENKIKKAQSDVLICQHLQIKLKQIFSNVIPLPSSTDESIFFTEKKLSSINFAFDNGIDPDPRFSGPVIGKLFFESNNLKLDIFPIDQKQKIKKSEILIKNISKAEFKFLNKSSKTNKWKWITQWSKEKNSLPPMIKLKLAKKIDGANMTKKVKFAFFLPSDLEPITYLENKK
jgi:hypothetical protein